MDKDKERQQDNIAEKKYMDDVDRIINEGLAGGTVSLKYDSGQIEETIDLEKEDPPNKLKE